MLKYQYIFQIKYTESISSNSTRELLWFEITEMLIAVFRNKLTVSFSIIFGTVSFPSTAVLPAGRRDRTTLHANWRRCRKLAV